MRSGAPIATTKMITIPMMRFFTISLALIFSSFLCATAIRIPTYAPQITTTAASAMTMYIQNESISSLSLLMISCKFSFRLAANKTFPIVCSSTLSRFQHCRCNGRAFRAGVCANPCVQTVDEKRRADGNHENNDDADDKAFDHAARVDLFFVPVRNCNSDTNIRAPHNDYCRERKHDVQPERIHEFVQFCYDIAQIFIERSRCQ